MRNRVASGTKYTSSSIHERQERVLSAKHLFDHKLEALFNADVRGVQLEAHEGMGGVEVMLRTNEHQNTLRQHVIVASLCQCRVTGAQCGSLELGVSVFALCYTYSACGLRCARNSLLYESWVELAASLVGKGTQQVVQTISKPIRGYFTCP